MRLNADMYSENDTDRRTTTKTVSHPQDITAEFCMCVCMYIYIHIYIYIYIYIYYNIVTKPTILNSKRFLIKHKEENKGGQKEIFRRHAAVRSTCWECVLDCTHTRSWSCCILCSGTGVPPDKRRAGRCGRDSRASQQNDRPGNGACILSGSGNACPQILARLCPVTYTT